MKTIGANIPSLGRILNPLKDLSGILPFGKHEKTLSESLSSIVEKIAEAEEALAYFDSACAEKREGMVKEIETAKADLQEIKDLIAARQVSAKEVMDKFQQDPQSVTSDQVQEATMYLQMKV